MADKAQRRYLFVAIDPAICWVFVRVYPALLALHPLWLSFTHTTFGKSLRDVLMWKFVLSCLAFFLIPLVVSANELRGRWSGYYYCSQGPTSFELILTGETIDDWLVEGVFRFYAHPSNPEVPSGSFKVHALMTGEEEFIVVPKGWIERPGDYNQIYLMGSLLERGSKMRGRIYSDLFKPLSCPGFQASR